MKMFNSVIFKAMHYFDNFLKLKLNAIRVSYPLMVSAGSIVNSSSKFRPYKSARISFTFLNVCIPSYERLNIFFRYETFLFFDVSVTGNTFLLKSLHFRKMQILRKAPLGLNNSMTGVDI